MRKNQLTRQGFMELNLMEATEKEGDPADLWITMEAMGYNRMLELVHVCIILWSLLPVTPTFCAYPCLTLLQCHLMCPSVSLELLSQACPFQIDVHCEAAQPSIQPVNMTSGPKLLSQALQKSITARAGARPLRGQENIFIYTYRGEHRISSLIANKVVRIVLPPECWCSALQRY